MTRDVNGIRTKKLKVDGDSGRRDNKKEMVSIMARDFLAFYCSRLEQCQQIWKKNGKVERVRAKETTSW